MHIISLLVSVLGIAVAVVHEAQWWRRRRWKHTTGTVVGETESDESIVPEIEYVFNGEAMRFVSKYGGRSVGVGARVRIVFDPTSGDAEELKWSNRWLPTTGLCLFSLFWAWAGISTWPSVE